MGTEISNQDFESRLRDFVGDLEPEYYHVPTMQHWAKRYALGDMKSKRYDTGRN